MPAARYALSIVAYVTQPAARRVRVFQSAGIQDAAHRRRRRALREY